MYKAYIFFGIIFIIIFVIYYFYRILIGKFEYLMGYIIFGFGVLTVISPIIMNNLFDITNKDKIKSLLQKKYASKI